MQQLDNLWKLINMAGNVRDMAQESITYQFTVKPPVTFYLHTELSSIVIRRHDTPEILVEATYQAGFGWKVQAEQDEAGVYLVAKRRLLVGTMSRARFVVKVPHDTFLVLKIENGSLELDDVSGEFHVAPLQKGNPIILKET